ncbi:hypothetical protein ABZW18_05620 [Streptomyces sp. NPDC004647]|uniref:hypothetical protein n=1 Tax=Streptomyces sp. NPDC004647 TaxID=3154671 RepID=UPI0033A2F8A8
MPWDPDTQLQEHAERYARGHDGQHPYTDVWPWAEAIVAWREQWLGGTWRRRVELQEGDRDLVVAGVAESLRLLMGRSNRPLGDLALDMLKGELSVWLRYGVDYPVPGETGWPAPTGPYADRWEAVMNVVRTDDVRGRRLGRAVTEILAALLAYGSERPHFPAPVYSGALMAYRLDEWGYDDVSLAEVAPVLGMATAVPVMDSRWYEGVIGLTVVEQSA